MQLLTSQLTLTDYLDIDIEGLTSDHYDNTKFVCDVTFKVEVDENGLSFDIYEVKNMGVSYNEIFYSEDGPDDEKEQDYNLDDFSKEYTIEKGNKEYQILSLDEVVINIPEKRIKLSFVY